MAHVHILSYVGSSSRERKAHQHAKALKCFGKLAGCTPAGASGGGMAKLTSAIFDTHSGVIRVCLRDRMMCFAIQTPKQDHRKLNASIIFKSFAEAVDQYFGKGGAGRPVKERKRHEGC